jgi:hypothetical protein
VSYDASHKIKNVSYNTDTLMLVTLGKAHLPQDCIYNLNAVLFAVGIVPEPSEVGSK